METLQTIAPGGEHEDPFTDAGQTGSSYVSLGLALTQRRVDAQIRRLGLQPRTDRQRDVARPKWSAMLAPDEGRSRSTAEALDAWIAATPHRDADRGARTAAGRAERRLSELHPEAMARYNDLRESLDPMDAMWVAASQFSSKEAETPIDLGSNVLESSAAATYESTVREVLDSRLADRVLADSDWSKLAGALSRVERQSGQGMPEKLLRLTVGQRELESARFPAKVLLHRIASEQAVHNLVPTASSLREALPSRPGTASYPATLASLRSPAARNTPDNQPPDSIPTAAVPIRVSHR